MFLRNLGVTLAAGVSLIDALQLFADEGTARQKRAARHLYGLVMKGVSLGAAMETSPVTFPPIAVNLTKAGELSGNLERNLQETATYLKKTHELRRSIRTAMLYPLFVLVTMFAVGMAVGLFVLPAIVPLFQSLDVPLTLSTKILIGTAAFFKDFGLELLLAIFCVALMLTVSWQFGGSRSLMQRVLLHIPYVGVLQRQSAMAQMGGTLATLLSSGIPLKEALPMCADAMSYLPYRTMLRKALRRIENGFTLYESIDNPRLVPGMALIFVRIGEKTGSLVQGLRYLSNYYDEEVSYSAKNLGVVLEPILLIIVGLLVAGMAMAIITPIYRVTGSIH